MKGKLIMALALTAALAAPVRAADREISFRGRKIAEANCAECHAIARFDHSENPSAPPFRTLAGRKSFATLRRSLAGDLFLRHAEMPDFEPAPGQVDDIVNFIESIQR